MERMRESARHPLADHRVMADSGKAGAGNQDPRVLKPPSGQLLAARGCMPLTGTSDLLEVVPKPRGQVSVSTRGQTHRRHRQHKGPQGRAGHATGEPEPATPRVSQSRPCQPRHGLARAGRTGHAMGEPEPSCREHPSKPGMCDGTQHTWPEKRLRRAKQKGGN